jgi:hypothetical protein
MFMAMHYLGIVGHDAAIGCIGSNTVCLKVQCLPLLGFHAFHFAASAHVILMCGTLPPMLNPVMVAIAYSSCRIGVDDVTLLLLVAMRRLPHLRQYPLSWCAMIALSTQ